MTRFNYLHDAPPEFIERLWPIRIPEPLRPSFTAIVTTVIVIAMWWGVERIQLTRTQMDLARAQARFAASRADLAHVRVRRSEVERLLSADARVREIRTSGALLAHRVADVANLIPKRAWLTRLERVGSRVDIEGDTIGIGGVSETISSLLRSTSTAKPALLRAGRDERLPDARVVTFELRAETR